jgi:hypothetical protein
MRLPELGLVCRCIGNDAGGDGFSENMMLMNRVSGAWWAWKGVRRRRKQICIGSALRKNSPGNMRQTLFKNSVYNCPPVSGILLGLCET